MQIESDINRFLKIGVLIAISVVVGTAAIYIEWWARFYFNSVGAQGRVEAIVGWVLVSFVFASTILLPYILCLIIRNLSIGLNALIFPIIVGWSLFFDEFSFPGIESAVLSLTVSLALLGLYLKHWRDKSLFCVVFATAMFLIMAILSYKYQMMIYLFE